MTNEKILVLIKPDGMVKDLIGTVMNDLSNARLKLIGAKVVKVSRELAEKHYGELKCNLLNKFGEDKGCKVYENVLDYIQGKYHTDRVLALVYSGEDAISRVRAIAGATNPEKAEPTSIRGKYGRIHSQTEVLENVLHCSDSVESAKREIELWFKPEEIVE